MDKMTDGKIRAWLEKNDERILKKYNAYLEAFVVDLQSGGEDEKDLTPHNPAPLRKWLEDNYPEILDRVPIW